MKMTRLLLLGLATAAWGQTDCSTFNKSDTPVPWEVYGSGRAQEHVTGQHDFQYTMGGQCTYTGTTPGAQCGISCSSSATAPLDSETGQRTNALYHHYLDETDNEGYAQAPAGGAQIQCQVTVAATVRSCLLTCAVTISFNASANGVGATVNFPPDAIFSRSSQLVTTCAPQQLPYCTGNPGFACCSSYNNGNPSCINGQWSCGNTAECPTPPPNAGNCSGGYWSCECSSGWQCNNTSPILIDTTGRGFHLTSVADGVKFDFFGNGKPIQMAWTAADSGNGFLVLDRDGNGRIDSAKEMFGSITEQPALPVPALGDDPGGNGYTALSRFDMNRDLVISSLDPIYWQLRVWIDANHNGISEPEELHTLAELQIYSIGLKYRDGHHVDQFGNAFQYMGLLNQGITGATSLDGRHTVDVSFAISHDQPFLDPLLRDRLK